MTFLISFGLACLIQIANSQWQTISSSLDKNSKYTYYSGYEVYKYSGYFVSASGTTTANFITCTTPPTSYITLNQASILAKYYRSQSYRNGYFVSVDLFFQGTWSSEIVTIVFGSFSYSYTYTSPTNYPLTTSFCDNIPADVKTINFTIASTTDLTQGQAQFTISNTNTGQVSIRNFYVSRPQCYPSCVQCTGPKFNQCTECYYGQHTNNICPPCPSNLYYMKYIGCKNSCDINSPLYINGFCQDYQISTIEQAYIYSFTSSENLKWSLIYDPQHIDTSPTIITYYYYNYGVFKFNSGLQRFFKRISSYSYATYLIGIKISILTYNDPPINCGIQFKINNTYFGSIYRNDSGIQTHKLKLFDINSYGSQMGYSQVKRYDLITYIDLPKYPFLFSAVGNYTDSTSGWGMISFQITSGFCVLYCQLCEVSFKCKTCISGYYNYKGGSCIYGCYGAYQNINGSYCYDYDDETIYSQFLVQEYTNEATDPEQYAQYTLISQSGTNFLKGLDIYYSYWQSYRVFGGPFVWAQAKFQRVHNIVDPHHSITIAFYILYGPSFPIDGQFIYTIENNAPVTKTIISYSSINPDGTKQDKVYQRITHNTNTLTMQWECFGPNNEPINAYCGFYNYFIAVHKCQPYCLQCSDQNTCTQWNSTYDSNIIKFSQAQCLINQYYDQDSVRCLDCPLPCLTCTSKLDCQTCQSTYTLSKLGCNCQFNQYEDQNQCFDCSYECNQCLSSTYCIECLVTNNRQLQNGQCICFDGYYPIIQNPKCQICHQFCKTCTGPTSNECLTCNNIVNIENDGSICRCPAGSYYQESIKTCSTCHSSCQTCFRATIYGCLTCDPSLFRILKGLRCECQSGYYESNNICTNCPITEDISLSKCYKLCNNNQYIWHTNICNSCDIGYQLISGECEPICGDSQIKGYEQCEDNNTLLDDLCYNCQYQCPAYCLTCDQQTTLPCPDICGDGYITGIEECEDGNTIQYDGCYNCNYQCQSSCTKCIKGECFECATEGWFIDPNVIPWQCKERCGDGIVVGTEQCEDGNTSDTDGCKDCKYYCRIGCSSCDYTTNTCLSCEFPGFVPQSYYCKNICGDRLVVSDPSGFYSEQCDDGNTINDDGCNNSCSFQCQPLSICTSCVSNRCEICAPEYFLTSNQICFPICGDSIKLANQKCEDGFVLPYKGCQNCVPKCQSSCLNCDTSGLGCLQCQPEYNRIDNLCYSICGDRIVTEDEQCDDGNLIYDDGCYFCQFSCQDSCLNCIKGVCYDCLDGYELIQFKCYPICGDGIQQNNEQCENTQLSQINCKSCKFSCVKNCKQCLLQQCIECEYGYYGNKCLPKCGDGIIVQQEECDDGNQYDLDTCLNCKYQCPQFCKYCAYGVCTYCQEGFYLDIVSNSCNSVCGDKILASDEVCDDGNELRYDGCFECKYQCQMECVDCQFGKCVQCESPLILVQSKGICEELKQCEGLIGLYYDSFTNDCLPQCGDGIVVGSEQCEDQNTIPYDGCYECQYQCQEGFLLYQNICITICGDGIVIDQYEDCDDQNDQPYDGCFECKFQCTQNCIVCQKGKCLQCDIYYSLKNNQCLLDNKNDDLNSSIIEQSQNNTTFINVKNPEWLSLNENKLCREYECVYSKKPSMKLTFQNQYFARQYVEITFDQEVKLSDQLIKDKKLFNISINDLDSQNYNITINSIQDMSFDLQYAQYQVVIEIFSQVQTKPVLLVKLNQEIVNSNNQTLINLNESITLQPPKIISEQMKSTAINAQKQNKAFMIGAISLCVISLGESSIVVETLNLLQYQSFLRFINVDYPENLQIYFEAQDLLSLTSYLQVFEIDDYVNIITRKEKQIELSGKFKQYNIESDIFTNILPQLIQFIGLISLPFFAKLLYKIFFYLSEYMIKFQSEKTLKSRILITMIKLLLNFRKSIKQLMKIRHYYNYNQIIQLIYINSWDLIFKVILQLHYNQIDNLRSILTTIFAALIFFIYINYQLKSLSLFNSPGQKNVKAMLELKFITFDIFRTMLFHTVLILFQDQSILQCLLISASSISSCYLIYKYKQCSKLDRIIFLLVEGILTVFSLSLFLYFDIHHIQISYEIKVTLGIFQMNLLIFSLALVCAKKLFPKIQHIKKLICRENQAIVQSSQLFQY